ADGDAGVLVLPGGVVAGDDVAADGRAAGATVNGNAGLLVAVGDLSAGIHADVVAEDLVALDLEAEGAPDLHAVAGVAADDVAAAHDEDALGAVGHGAVAVVRGADQVVDQSVAVALEEHAYLGVAGDQVTVGVGRRADDVARGAGADLEAHVVLAGRL